LSPDTFTTEQWRDRTATARRKARFLHARERVRRIRDGQPRLTDEELAELAQELLSGTAA
jgi:hypothetical protein